MGQGTEHAIWLRSILKAEQERRGWSYADLAEAVARELGVDSISRQTVYQWLAFESQPKIDQFAALARALDFRLEVDLVRIDQEVEVIRVPPAVGRIVRMLLRAPAKALEAIASLLDLIAPEHDPERPAD